MSQLEEKIIKLNTELSELRQYKITSERLIESLRKEMVSLKEHAEKLNNTIKIQSKLRYELVELLNKLEEQSKTLSGN